LAALRYTFTVAVHPSEMGLGSGVALVGSLTIPLHRLREVALSGGNESFLKVIRVGRHSDEQGNTENCAKKFVVTLGHFTAILPPLP